MHYSMQLLGDLGAPSLHSLISIRPAEVILGPNWQRDSLNVTWVLLARLKCTQLLSSS